MKLTKKAAKKIYSLKDSYPECIEKWEAEKISPEEKEKEEQEIIKNTLHSTVLQTEEYYMPYFENDILEQKRERSKKCYF